MIKIQTCLTALITTLCFGCMGSSELQPEPKESVSEALSPGAFVQQAFVDSNNNVSSTSKAFPAAEKLNDTNVVLVGWNNATTTITSVTDTQGLTYHVAAALTHFPGAPCGAVGLSQAIYYATGTNASKDTIKVTLSGSTPGVDMRIGEYAGVLTFDQGASATGSANPAATSAMTLSGNDLVVAGGYICGTFTGAGSGFTLRKLTTFGALYEDRTTNSSSFTPTGASDETDWVFQAAAFSLGGSDAGTDAATEASTDASQDVVADVVDANQDVVETGIDAAQDSPPDVIEASDDASPDATQEAESGDDSGVEASAETGTDADSDAGNDATVSATPTLVQMIGSATETLDRGITGNSLTFTPPNPVLTGNALIVGVAYTSGTTWAAVPVTDTLGNAWANAPTAIVHDTQNNMDEAIFVLPNTLPGVDTISLHWTAAIPQFQFVFSEFANVASASPVSGTSGASGVLAPTITTGTFTPANNDAQGGNLIWSYFFDDSNFGSGNKVSSFTPGSGFTLMEANISPNINVMDAVEYTVQTTDAPITPSMIATMSPNKDSFIGLSVALSAAQAGTLPGSGIRIVGIHHNTNESPGSTLTAQVPSHGNAIVFATANASQWNHISSMTDNKGNTYTPYQFDSSVPQFFVASNAITGSDLAVTIHESGNTGMSFSFFDIAGAGTVDTTAFVDPFGCSNVTSITNAPIISPTGPGLTIATVGLGQGPGRAVVSPTGATFDMATYAGETDIDTMENADLRGHLYNTAADTEHWNWTMSSQPNDSCFATAIHLLSH